MASNNMSPLRNFLNSIKSSVYNISIDGIGNTDINATELFRGFPSIYRITSLNDMNYVTNMHRIFCLSNKLISIPNYNFNTSNVINMRQMFWRCNNLTTVPNFDTSNVTDMYGMFDGCENLTSIPNFDTSNVTNMHSMLSSCNNITTVPNFNTSKVTDMAQMFYMRRIKTVPNFDTSNVTNMNWMFAYAFNLINIPNFNTSKVKDMGYMFYQCGRLDDIPNFDMSNVTKMESMFERTDIINLPVFNWSKVTNMPKAFISSTSFSQASVNNIVTSCSTATKVTNKNWTNIGFNVAAGSKWNTWIRTAPDYMNAVNIGWQNIGDAIKSDMYKEKNYGWR